MPRAQRQFTPGGLYHVFARGSNKQAIFTFDSDRVDFLLCLSGAIAHTKTRCLAYCLMSNHYHLVVSTEDGELSRTMKALNGRYALRFNTRYGRQAHLFKNRFGAVHQKTTAQLLWTLRYVVTNPVARGMCATPEDWVWSSYRASVGLERRPRFLDVKRLLSYFGDVPEKQRDRYRDFVANHTSV